MHRWAAETDIQTPTLTEGKNEAEKLNDLAGQQPNSMSNTVYTTSSC